MNKKDIIELIKQARLDAMGVEGRQIIDSKEKQLIVAMNYEFVILIIKLSSRLAQLDELDEEAMDNIQETCCKLQSMTAQIIGVTKDDLNAGVKMAMDNHKDDGDGKGFELIENILNDNPVAES